VVFYRPQRVVSGHCGGSVRQTTIVYAGLRLVNVKLKINPKSINSQKPINLSVNNQIWEINLKNEVIPIPIQGIATESEPRVDIFMKLLN
jgi:hypothetical protein